MREQVLVVGGGVSGLFLGSLIGDGIRIVEEHRNIGYPEHCTGIISTDTLYRMKIPRRLVEASFDKFVLYFPGGYRIVLRGSPLAVKVDRPGIEREFYYRALDRGARILLGTHVDFLSSNGKAVFNKEVHENELIILAEGYKQYFSRKLGLIKKSIRIPAIQARIKGHVHISNVEVYFSTLTPSYFSWLVPISDEEAVVGLASNEKSRLIDKLHLMLKVLEKTSRISSYRIQRMYGGLVLRGSIGDLVRDRIVAIGDSVGMVKPLTGGGLYPISIAGTTLSKLINKYVNGSIGIHELKQTYVEELKTLKSNLETTHRLLDIIGYRIEVFLEIIARGLNRLNMNTIIDEVEYDDHLKNILTLFKPKNKVKLIGSFLTGLV